MFNEENIKSGAIASIPDGRDYIYEKLGFVSSPFDWDTGYDVEDIVGKIKIKDQASSYSCGGQAWSYYMSCLDNDNEEKSAKFIYAQTHVGHGGSSGRDNCSVCKNKGDSDEKLCLSYPATEQNLITNDITPEAFTNALKDKALSYVSITDWSWDNLAQKIRDNKGIVIGIFGKNNGTWLSKFPTPPDKIDNDCWAHWIYVCKAKMIDGKKYLGFTNSWGTFPGDNGIQWIGEEYSKYLWEIWAMVYDNQDKYIFTQILKVGSKGFEVKQLQRVLGIKMDGIFGPKTKAAVQIYQTKNHLSPDGIVGPRTRAVLNNE